MSDDVNNLLISLNDICPITLSIVMAGSDIIIGKNNEYIDVVNYIKENNNCKIILAIQYPDMITNHAIIKIEDYLLEFFEVIISQDYLPYHQQWVTVLSEEFKNYYSEYKDNSKELFNADIISYYKQLLKDE